MGIVNPLSSSAIFCGETKTLAAVKEEEAIYEDEETVFRCPVQLCDGAGTDYRGRT